jgi:serine/threonine protein kinase/tetratricopeptide (TPR) repeat protein
MIGKTISHYRIVEKLGEGGMGVVYKAEDITLGRAVALKFLPAELTRDAIAKERFIQEARAASALDHPNICNIHEVGQTDDGQTFIAMAYYEGEDLKSRIGRGPLKLDEALDIAIQSAQGLAKAHGQGIVHRDIKPANMLITTDGLVKIVDFGLAKLAGTKVTRMGSTLGTARYMSPEQARGEDVDHRTDIWSLGVVLYEMATGKPPFPGEYEQATFFAIKSEEPEPVTALRSGVPMELERIIKKCLAKKPADRYQHADDLIVDLRECAKETVSERRKGMAVSPRGKARLGLQFWIPAAIVVVAVLVIILLNPFNLQIGLKKTAAADRKSIAVLPFRNMSDSKEDEYFSDGITEDIITQLSNIGELKVISRTSAMQYKNTGKNLREIARELNVVTVLEGSVRRAGNQVRIVAQLIDATNDEHLWAQTYDKEMTQIFAIQSDVAQQIASALKAKLSPAAKEKLNKKPTENLDAYAYYLKGRDYYYRYTTRDNDNAIELFKKALQLDPKFALAYAGLGDAYGQRGSSIGWSTDWSDSAIAASEKAISLDPNRAEGYKALGLAYSCKGWIRKSREAYEKALEINPNYGPALGNMGYNSATLGRLDEALTWQKRSVAADPMLAIHYDGTGSVYAALGDDAKALEWFNKALAIEPDLTWTFLDLGWMRLKRGEYEQAVNWARKVLAVQPEDAVGLELIGLAELLRGNLAEAGKYFEKGIAVDSSYGPNTQLGCLYWKTGRKDQARKPLARSLRGDNYQLDRGSEDPGVRYNLARVNAIQGNTTESLAWLQKAIDGGWRDYLWTEIDPSLENIRGDDRFKRMMAGVKAQVDEMRKRVEEAESKEADSGEKD